MTSPSRLHHSFALIKKDQNILLYQGECVRLDTLEELNDLQKKNPHPIVFLLPFCVARENGCEVRGQEKILALVATKVRSISRAEINILTENLPLELEKELQPDTSEEDFTKEVKRIQEEEIAGGKACQVVFSRKFQGTLKNMAPQLPLVLFRRLLNQQGSYMTFLFADGKEDYFVGATPERQVEVTDKAVIKSPLAGTMPKGEKEGFKNRVKDFLNDTKEINELAQILDEELKMMARLCPQGGKIQGPFLRETGAVIHTEYRLVGRGPVNGLKALKECFHAPTLVGSPLKSAFRIIAKREKSSREYYGGEIGILNPDGTLDSAILIRTAAIKTDGQIKIQAGAGIVRDSVPAKEAQETRVKAMALIKALSEEKGFKEAYLENDIPTGLKQLLQKRNRFLSRFHCQDQFKSTPEPELKNIKVTLVHNDDDFAYMMAHMINHFGCQTKVVDTFEFNSKEDQNDLIILGPGPGDINDPNDSRMKKLLAISNELLQSGKPLLGICLGHQAIAKSLGIPVVRQKIPTQGLQQSIDLFGKKERVGFYNSFSPGNENIPQDVEVSLDENKSITAMRRPGMIGYQFHPESVLSQNGYRILKGALKSLVQESKSSLNPKEIRSFIKESISQKKGTKEQIKFLEQLNKKGYTAIEVVEFVKLLQEQQVSPLKLPGAIDLCGTGGSGLPRINTSTLAAFVVAACGVRVAKHGNKAAGGRFGSFDLLEKMDIQIDANKKTLERLFKKTNLAFIFARTFHPAMRHFAEARKEISTKTIFNLLGPLLNPAQPQKQIIGTSSIKDMHLIVEACRILKKEHVLVVCGEDGLDEVTLTGPTHIRELHRGKITSYQIRPEDFGFKTAPFRSIAGGNEVKNISLAEAILQNRCHSDHLKLVLMNAALALKFTGKVQTVRDGVKMAQQVIRKGIAQELLINYRRESHCSDLLAEIAEHKIKEVVRSQKKIPLSTLKKNLKKSTRDFAAAFKNKNRINLIAEIKRSSPSHKNLYRGNKSAAEIGKIYEAAGVSAISVLTDQKFFDGNLEDLRATQKATKKTPLLRKDFIVDEYQIYEARRAGADAILLIVALLNRPQIDHFIKIAKSLNMAVMVEIHNERELKIALQTKAKIIGINNRDLNTFKIDPLTVLRLAPQIPKNRTLIAESSYHINNIRLGRSVAHGFLIGTAILKTDDISKTIQKLKESPKLFKACGIRTVSEAKLCEEIGIPLVGLNFVPSSKRSIGLEAAKKIRSELKSSLAVGVFQNQPLETVQSMASELKLDLVQLSGKETNDYCRSIKQPILKTVRIDEVDDMNFSEEPDNVIGYIIDSQTPGSGKSYDHSKLKKFNFKKPFLIAGGIDIHNVEEVLKMLPECLGIDTASGIETAGKVDRQKIKQFMKLITHSHVV